MMLGYCTFSLNIISDCVIGLTPVSKWLMSKTPKNKALNVSQLKFKLAAFGDPNQ